MRRLNEAERALLARLAAAQRGKFEILSQGEQAEAAELVRRGFAIRSWYRAALRITPAGRYLIERRKLDAD